jgi:phosphoribosyl 1,2-cyclic phosphodiesterase
MKLTILASGSKANAAVLDTGETRILIDAGLSATQLITRMEMAGIEPYDISGIVITHEHSDHVAGLCRFFRSGLHSRIPIYVNHMTMQAIPNKNEFQPWRIFGSTQGINKPANPGFMIGKIHVEPFSVSHDAADPVGFIFSGETKVLGFATDLGQIHAEEIERLKQCSTVFLEANYSDELLARDTTRPWGVRQRIMSANGHLSNHQAAEAISALPQLRKAILGHLSNATNSPERAMNTVHQVRDLAGLADIEVAVAFTPERDRCKPPQVIQVL